MTIIAFKAGIMAADSLVVDNDRASFLGRGDSKIAKVFGGSGLLGVSGDHGFIPLLVEAVEKKGLPELIGTRLLIRATDGAEWDMLLAYGGRLIYASNDNPPHYIRDPEAIGSGAALAVGAMAHGASATQAAAIAAKHSTSCGGKITWMQIPWSRPSEKKASRPRRQSSPATKSAPSTSPPAPVISGGGAAQ